MWLTSHPRELNQPEGERERPVTTMDGWHANFNSDTLHAQQTVDMAVYIKCHYTQQQ